MNGKPISILFVLFCMVVLAACSSGAQDDSTGIPVTGNDNSSATQPADSAVTEPASSANGPKLNLNTATEDEFLAAVPGLGERMVDEFLEYRPYVSIEQFREEIGEYVDAAQVAAYEKYVYVPISINDSDAATLQQIPGLSEEEAEALIAA